MRSLELKIPPPIVALLIGGAMWGASLISRPPREISTFGRGLSATILAVVAVLVSVSGVVAFRRAKTTLNPIKPQDAASLVTTGIYRFTRNPMYLGLLTLLLAWSMLLFSPLALAGPIVLVLYLNHFQIAPEERALTILFGPAFTTYTSRVRRWL